MICVYRPQMHWVPAGTKLHQGRPLADLIARVEHNCVRKARSEADSWLFGNQGDLNVPVKVAGACSCREGAEGFGILSRGINHNAKVTDLPARTHRPGHVYGHLCSQLHQARETVVVGLIWAPQRRDISMIVATERPRIFFKS